LVSRIFYEECRHTLCSFPPNCRTRNVKALLLHWPYFSSGVFTSDL
jgi:hypothetical protein